jgi:exodeoxyribonuclease VII small subunit
VPLDEALALYERGEALHRALAERLDRAELTIEELRVADETNPRDTAPPAG